MKLKLLLVLFLISCGIINAQEPNRSLIISESRSNAQPDNYVELTNMGDQPINLSEYKFGLMRPWIPEPVDDVWNDPWVPEGNRFFMLPNVVLQPGESWVITTAYDFGPEQYQKKVPGFEGDERRKQVEMYDLADYLIHIAEPKGDETDSVTHDDIYGDAYQWTFETWVGRGAFYIEHHVSDVDSFVVDQVNGVFDNEGKNFAHSYDVAGVTDATGNSVLVRKFTVKTGNLDFANARGVGLDDSEWIPIPQPEGEYRLPYWTVGNHGAYNLDENTLVSDEIDVDFANKVLTVPWGTRRGDGIMKKMQFSPGVAWVYKLSPNFEDSLTFAARTGDQIDIYVCGDDLDLATFDIVVAEPTADANIVVPVSNFDPGGGWRDNNEAGILDWPRVTEHESGVDTITGNWFGIPYATRTDSLLERLEKASNAAWDFDWVDGVERADLKNGDKLVVTAENGDTKEYYVQVQPYGPSHNAALTAITWPDIPAEYRDIFGWMGDTIPNFNSTTYNYRVQVPWDVEGIPALVAKTASLNANVEVVRATTLSGTVDQRTVKFIVTAEDDSVSHTYNVELVKEKDISKLQPYAPDPFLSEFVFWDQWSNSFAEIMNPGNQPLDLSNYMFAMEWITNPADMITSGAGEDEWLDRYDKYVPGYKWVDEATWAVTPAILEQDLNVNPIVQPGDVFTMGYIAEDGQTEFDWLTGYTWPVPAQLDVQFNNYTGNKTYENPWGEPVSDNGSPVRKWSNSQWYMFKILNDSVKLGLKPATDPNDFELIEVFGMGETTDWVIGGESAQMITNWIRKPNIYQGNPDFAGSFGTNWDDAEWTKTDQPYWEALNVGYPMTLLNIGNDIGQHFMNPPTHYMSTVTSVVYKVSDGYSMDEKIRGVRTGQTVSDLFGNIVKANENQSVKVTSAADGSELAADALLSMNDTLVVMSADSTNTTKYVLDVTEEGLNSNAVLTSTKYDIEITQQPSAVGEKSTAEMGSGTISGFEYGTQLKTILANITVPPGANITVINDKGAYVPQTTLNYDTSYVSVTVNHNTYFDVVAEDGVTEIKYQLQPQASESSAFLTSDIYAIDQKDLLVQYVPRGTSVDAFLGNVIPSIGASIKVVDKNGLERTDGQIYQDDRVIVTSPNEEVQNVYYLAMLRSQYLQEPAYLAYVTSNVYPVNQVEMKITNLGSGTEISTFHSRINPAMGATAVVVDADGNEKTSGTLNTGDMLKVTSADEKVTVYYMLYTTSANFENAASISVYPNPTNGRVNISGAEIGGRIQVFSATGANIRNFNVQRSIETVTLDDQPAGIYLIVVNGKEKLLGRYKVLKR